MSNLADAIRASKHEGMERTMALLQESLASAVEADQAFRVLPAILPTRAPIFDKYHLPEVVSIKTTTWFPWLIIRKLSPAMSCYMTGHIDYHRWL